MSNYTISAKCEHTDATDSPSIPLDILSKIQVVASVPDYLSTDEASVPFVIRLRTVDLEDAQCKRLRVTCFRIDVKQTEKYRGLPSSEYASRYLVPPSSAQPPNEPLLAPHSFHALYESGLVDASVSLHQTVARSFSVMHPAQFGDYQIAGDGYIFSDDYNCREMPTWYTIHGGVKLSRSSSRSCQLRVSGNSPLFGVRHEVHVSLTCVYDTPETSEPVTEQLNFSVPLRFVHVTPRPLSRNTSPSPSLTTPNLSSFISSTEPAPEAEMLTSGLPYAHSLPAYSQLFDSNGDRHIDYSIPLPVYTPHTLPSPDHCEFDAGGGGGKSVFL